MAVCSVVLHDENYSRGSIGGLALPFEMIKQLSCYDMRDKA